MKAKLYIVSGFVVLLFSLICLGSSDNDNKESIYTEMVCIHKNDINNGVSQIDANGWPNYKNIEVVCTK